MASEQDRKDEQLERAVRHSAGIGMGFFALTLLAKQLIDKTHAHKHNEFQDKIKSYVDARYPVIAPEMSQTGGKNEEALAALGVPKVEDLEALEKHAEDTVDKPSKIREAFDKFLNPIPTDPTRPLSVGNFADAFGSRQVHPAHIAMTLAAALGGSYGGIKLGQKLTASSEESHLDKRIARARNELDILLHDEYRRTRGLDKNASTENVYGVEDDDRSRLLKGMTALPKLYLLYAAGIGALSYATAKKYMDMNDPNRARIKALQEIAKDRARMNLAPQIQEDPNDPTFSKLMAKER
jgi:hypothetical protein